MSETSSSRPLTIHKLWIVDPDLIAGYEPLHLCRWLYIEEWINRVEGAEVLCRGEYRSIEKPDQFCTLGHAFEVHNLNQNYNYSLWRVVASRDTLGLPRKYWQYIRNPFTVDDWYGLGRCKVLYEFSRENPTFKSVELVSFSNFLYALNDKYLLSPRHTAEILKASLHPGRKDAVLTEPQALERMKELSASYRPSSIGIDPYLCEGRKGID